ncbi:MAG: GH92 family glycosyl hydrolase, partial [Bacteroidales bacterium]|nr:GH92 family glycosyl hydrolase [Bacteroidales bacterium]
GTGAGDLYDISFMPVTLPCRIAPPPLGIHSTFSHEDETASAGYYSVLLKDYGILAELTATERCGVQRYTFPEADAEIILNLRRAMNWDATVDSGIEVIDSVTVQGWRFSEGWARHQKVYFRTRFSRPFDDMTLDTRPTFDGGRQVGNAVVAKFDFKTSEGEQITVSTSISGTGLEGAAMNLEAEVPQDDFDNVLAQTREAWNKALSVIETDFADVGRKATKETQKAIEDQKTVFYTALYHSMLAPTIFADIDCSYLGPDKTVHNADGWTNYGTFSLWDTFRAAHPLYTLIQPARVNDMVHSLLAFHDQSGFLPVWSMWGGETNMMIGYHAVPVIVDAILKGLTDADPKAALDACTATAKKDAYRGIGHYKTLGYVPSDVPDNFDPDDWSLSKTLEYAFDDWCIALLAEHVGEAQTAAEFRKRSQNWRNVYNPATTFMQPRDSKGHFQKNFSPDDYSAHICESNGWQYFWSVQHDIDGLIDLVGGRERFTEKLDSMFTYNPSADADLPLFSTGMIGQYAHGNEPSHHVIYLYNKVGQPWKTQKYAAQVLRELYRNDPAGLCGNEDCGQMSAWYVFSALGLYPANPVGGIYELGSPLFQKATLHLPDGRDFTVIAHNAGGDNIYVQGVKLNGEPYEETYITHDLIMAGATLEFEMGSTYNGSSSNKLTTER